MNVPTKIAITGALLSVLAAPVYAAKDMAKEMPGAKAGHSEQHHGRNYGGHGRSHNAMMGGEGIITTFDTDGNGRVTQAEIDQYRGNRLVKFDADGNGKLTLSEYESLWLAAMREKMVDRFQDLDADGDGVVTIEEFKRPYAKLVSRMDKNGDGVLSREHGKMGEEKKE